MFIVVGLLVVLLLCSIRKEVKKEWSPRDSNHRHLAYQSSTLHLHHISTTHQSKLYSFLCIQQDYTTRSTSVTIVTGGSVYIIIPI